jgi:hypothetical protein
MVTADWSVSRWFRPVVASLIVLGMFIGLNWCFSEMASAIRQAVQPEDTASSGAFSFLGQNLGSTDEKRASSPPLKDAPVPEAAGRHDPFAPLAEDPNANGGSAKTPAALAAKDPFVGVQYTGIVNSRQAGGALAMLQVNDPLLGVTTVIRKAGEVVDMPGGQTAKLISVSSQQLVLNLGGKTRVLPLRPLLDEPAQPAAPVGSPAGSSLGSPVALPGNAVR